MLLIGINLNLNLISFDTLGNPSNQKSQPQSLILWWLNCVFHLCIHIDLQVLFLIRVLVHLAVEEMQVVIYPTLPLPPGAETRTNREDERTELKELKADKMETIESW